MNTALARSRDSVPRLLHPLDDPPRGVPANLPALLDILVSPILRAAAVLIPLIERPHGTQVLFTLRNADLAHHGGQVSFPGGRLEPGESVMQGALREAAEEIDAEARFIAALGYLDPVATISGFRVTPVVAWLSADAVLRADPSEVSEIFEVPLAHLRDPASRGERIVQWLGRERRTSAYRHDRHEIWGVTAQIVDQLIALPHACMGQPPA